MIDFVDRIDGLLAKKGLNRNALYSEFDIPKNLIGIWKQRGTIPNAEIACKIASFLDTTVEYLVTGEENDSAKAELEELKRTIKDFANKLQRGIAVHNLIGVRIYHINFGFGEITEQLNDKIRVRFDNRPRDVDYLIFPNKNFRTYYGKTLY